MPAVAANSRSAADDDLSGRMVACRRGKIEPEGFALVRGADQAVALRRQREAGRAEFPVEPVENRRGIGGAVEIDRHPRSEERRVREEGGSTGRAAWLQYT